jgi:hypothetical protein
VQAVRSFERRPANYYSRQALREAFRREDGSYEPGFDDEHSYMDFHAVSGTLLPGGPALGLPWA